MSGNAKKTCRCFLRLAALIALGVSARVVRAQAWPTVVGPGSNIRVGVGGSFYQADYGQRVLGGGMVFIDAHPTWRYGIEAEARFLRFHTSENVTETNYFAGPQVVLLPGKIRPYVKFLVGAGKIDFPFHYAQGTYFAYAPGAGIDYRINDRLSLRMIDFEYQTWPQFNYGKLQPYGVSFGLSIRVDPLTRIVRR